MATTNERFHCTSSKSCPAKMVQRHTTNQLCLEGFERAVVHPKMTSTQNFLPTVSQASFRIPLFHTARNGKLGGAAFGISYQAFSASSFLSITLYVRTKNWMQEKRLKEDSSIALFTFPVFVLRLQVQTRSQQTTTSWLPIL